MPKQASFLNQHKPHQVTVLLRLYELISLEYINVYISFILEMDPKSQNKQVFLININLTIRTFG